MPATLPLNTVPSLTRSWTGEQFIFFLAIHWRSVLHANRFRTLKYGPPQECPHNPGQSVLLFGASFCMKIVRSFDCFHTARPWSTLHIAAVHCNSSDIQGPHGTRATARVAAARQV